MHPPTILLTENDPVVASRFVRYWPLSKSISKPATRCKGGSDTVSRQPRDNNSCGQVYSWGVRLTQAVSLSIPGEVHTCFVSAWIMFMVLFSMVYAPLAQAGGNRYHADVVIGRPDERP